VRAVRPPAVLGPRGSRESARERALPPSRSHPPPQYLGHYLSGAAIFLENQGATPAGRALAAKVDGLLGTLAAVQAAWGAAGEPGFLYPYSPSSFDALIDEGRNCAPVCVPFYVLHKMLAGLLDLAARAGSARAGAMAEALGAWAAARVARGIAAGGAAGWQRALGTEWGGMNDALNNLARATGNATYAATASLFNHYAWTAPLVVHDDQLGLFHANTHIPEVIGDLNGYALSGNETQRAIVDNFLDMLLANHSWATGGSNDHEFWSAPRTLGDFLNADTEETCTQYNIVKLTSARGDLSGDARWYDWTERQLANGLLGNQNTGGRWADTDSVGFHYMLPLGGGGLQKPWGDSSEGFPCCWGTSVEQFSGRHLELVFTRSPDDATLFVNLFYPVALAWASRGALTVTQEAGWPASTTSTTRLTLAGVGAGAAGAFALALRVPGWTTAAGARVTVNGARVAVAAAGAYVRIARQWASGDVVEAYFPATLSWTPVTDDRPQYAGWGAISFGAVLLAGVNVSSDRAVGLDGANLAASIVRVPDEGALRFVLSRTDACAGDNATAVALMPLGEVKDETYVAYWRTAAEAPVAYNGTARTRLPGGAAAWRYTGGASTAGGGADGQIRSGDPGDRAAAILGYAIDSSVRGIAGLALNVSVNAGYGPAGAPGAATFTVAVLDACAAEGAPPLAVAYASAPIAAPAYDACSTCYANIPIDVRLPAVVARAGAVVVALIFENNARNLNIALPLDVAVVWA